MKNSNYIIMMAAALLGASAFLPWISVSLFGFTDITTGVDANDGWIVLSLAIIAGLLGWAAPRWALIPGAAALGLGIYELYDLFDSTRGLEGFEDKGIKATIEYGMYLLLAASFTIVVTATYLFKKRSESLQGKGLT